MRFECEWVACHHEYDMIGNRCHPLIEFALMVPETSGQNIVRHYAKTDLVGYQNDRARGIGKRVDKRGGLARNISLLQRQVRKPKRETIDQDTALGRHLRFQCARQLKWFLDRRPIAAATGAMCGDPRSHLVISCLACRQINPIKTRLLDQALGVPALARARTAQDETRFEGQGHDNSL